MDVIVHTSTPATQELKAILEGPAWLHKTLLRSTNTHFDILSDLWKSQVLLSQLSRCQPVLCPIRVHPATLLTHSPLDSLSSYTNGSLCAHSAKQINKPGHCVNRSVVMHVLVMHPTTALVFTANPFNFCWILKFFSMKEVQYQ